MKKTTYTFNNTINEKKNDSEFLDALIEAGFLKENPWFNNKENADKEIKFIDEINNLIDALITPTKPKKKTTIEIEITKKKKNNNISLENILNYLSNMNIKNSYDGLTLDGTPFKIYDTFIQVGYDYIPFTASSFILNSLKPATKNNIMEIYIDLTK